MQACGLPHADEGLRQLLTLDNATSVDSLVVHASHFSNMMSPEIARLLLIKNVFEFIYHIAQFEVNIGLYICYLFDI